MNPARSLMVTSTLSSRAHSASTSDTTSSAVTTVLTTSTSFITGAGLKKCIPMTWLGRPVATEISVTDRELVLVARIASGWQTRSSSAKICRLRSSCSGTASTTRSTSARSAIAVVQRIWASSASRSAGDSLPFATARSVEPVRVARPRSRAVSLISTACTAIPLRAKTSTIPAPMVPSPTTPTVRNSRATLPSLNDCSVLPGSLPCPPGTPLWRGTQRARSLVAPRQAYR